MSAILFVRAQSRSCQSFSIALFCAQLHIFALNYIFFALNYIFLHWFGINWHVRNQLECRNCCLYIINKKRPCLNTQSDSIRAKLFIQICHFLHAYFTFYRLARYILSCQILLSFHLKIMTWSHRNVVQNFFRLSLSLDV